MGWQLWSKDAMAARHQKGHQLFPAPGTVPRAVHKKNCTHEGTPDGWHCNQPRIGVCNKTMRFGQGTWALGRDMGFAKKPGA
jgi:hypothetical protein